MNRLQEPVFMAVPKPKLTEFGIHNRLESCGLWFVAGLESFSSPSSVLPLEMTLSRLPDSRWRIRESTALRPST